MSCLVYVVIVEENETISLQSCCKIWGSHLTLESFRQQKKYMTYYRTLKIVCCVTGIEEEFGERVNGVIPSLSLSLCQCLSSETRRGSESRDVTHRYILTRIVTIYLYKIRICRKICGAYHSMRWIRFFTTIDFFRRRGCFVFLVGSFRFAFLLVDDEELNVYLVGNHLVSRRDLLFFGLLCDVRTYGRRRTHLSIIHRSNDIIIVIPYRRTHHGHRQSHRSSKIHNSRTTTNEQTSRNRTNIKKQNKQKQKQKNKNHQ